MNHEDIQQLFSLRNEYRELRYDLRNIEALSEALGNPQRRFRSVLIAGTNGKGSVARLLAAMVPDAGLYVSPHLVRLNERISIGGIEIDDSELEEAFLAVGRAIDQSGANLLYPPTYFERVTAMAFFHFGRRVAHAVLEVGLGGRLDATNIVSQDVSVITNIGYDHQEHLGSTLEKIAAEKAGIIKEVEPVVVGRGAGLEVIRQKAGSRLVDAGALEPAVRDLGAGCYEIDVETPIRSYSKLRPRFRGRHQIENLMVAIRAAECLEQKGWLIDAARIAEGVAAAVWPGRLERFEGRPAFMIDGGHNVSAVQAVGRFLDEYHPEKVWLIFGTMGDKDWPGMLEIFSPRARQIILTRPSNERAADPRAMAELVSGAIVCDSVAAAIDCARSHAEGGDTVLIAGSLYLAGEARAILSRGG